MPDSLKVPLLNDLAPNGFFYGGHYIVEFDPDSLWYETSLTIAALALKQDMKTEYHVFQHFPSEALQALSRLGVDAEKLKKEGLLSVWDSYTETVKCEAEKKGQLRSDAASPNLWVSTHEKPLDVKGGAAYWAERASAGYSDKDKRWLHVDDNTAIFLQYNDEKDFIDNWRTAVLPYGIRARETPHFLAFVKGVASEAFYTKFEALCDGVIDIKAQEEGGRIENYVRVRMLRGKTFDSSWHRLMLGSNGEVRLGGTLSQGEKRRLAAIMFTDMVGFTALAQRNESLSLSLVEEQRKLLRPIFARHDGREVKTIGDAFLVEFASALEAVRCAYDIQRATREFNISVQGDRRIHLRIGVHLGDVVESQGDISGDAVNVASRIQPLADDGGVCLTQQVYDHVQNKFDVPLVSKGKMTLKNVSEPIEVYRMVMPWMEEKVVSPARHDNSRVAVLPLVNMTNDPGEEYFADGMTEEMISTLSNISGLAVISRTSSMQYKGAKKSLVDIGRELGAGTLLEGSVRKAGSRVRITVQLLDASEDRHLWVQSYDRELEDIFAVQSDVATNVADALKVRLLDKEAVQIRKKHAENIEAYTLYLKGRFQWNKRDKEGVLGSLKLFQEAIRMEPDYARAFAGLADAYIIAATYGFMNLADGRAKSKEAATKALELDDTLAEAHASLGANLHNGLRYEEAQREFRRAIELNPSYASVHQWYSEYLQDMGRMKEAKEEMEKARELDPLSPVITFWVGQMNFYDRRLDEAIAIFDKLIENEPTYASSYWGRAYCFALKGMKERAYADLEALHRLVQNEDRYKVHFAIMYERSGEREKVLSTIEELIPKVGKSSVGEEGIAELYAILGEGDEFFKWIDKAVSAKRISAGHLRYCPGFDKVREDPRFPEIFKKLGLPYSAVSTPQNG